MVFFPLYNGEGMGRTVNYIIIAIGLLVAVLSLTTLLATHSHNHNRVSSLATVKIPKSAKLVYIAVRPDENLSSLPNVVLRAKLVASNVDSIIKETSKYSSKIVFVVIDLRGSTENSLVAAATISKTLVHGMKRPVILIGSPSEIMLVVSKFAKTYGVPVLIALSRNKRPVADEYKKIDSLVYAYIPSGVTGHPVMVTNIVSGKDKALLIRELGAVLQRIIYYTSRSGHLRRAAEPSFTLSSSTAPLIAQLDVSAEFKPWGKINARDALYQVLDDGNPSYNWFIYRFIDQIIPGDHVWNNGWHNNVLIQAIDADYNDPTGFLSYYDPSTYVGKSATTKTVELGIFGGKDKDGASLSGSLTRGYSWSYSKPGIEVLDRSDYALELAKWENRIDKSKAMGISTVQLEPGAVIRYPETGVHHFKTEYTGQWAKKNCHFFGHICSWDYSDYATIVVYWTLQPPS